MKERGRAIIVWPEERRLLVARAHTSYARGAFFSTALFVSLGRHLIEKGEGGNPPICSFTLIYLPNLISLFPFSHLDNSYNPHLVTKYNDNHLYFLALVFFTSSSLLFFSTLLCPSSPFQYVLRAPGINHVDRQLHVNTYLGHEKIKAGSISPSLSISLSLTLFLLLSNRTQTE